ncbi:MAG TPA: TonB-dependent receptor, partial [Bacteroidetes bacterium]|nr:TonB-dependent receptor [Bacteroidota bacterium]
MKRPQRFLAALSTTAVFLSFFLFVSGAAAQHGRIVGTVSDSLSGNALPGANIFFPGLNIGTTSNIRGEFFISNAPVGRHVLRVDYMGYARKEIPVNVRVGQTLRLDIKLRPAVVRGKAVVVTAQASAQTQAINQQLTAKTIKNVVSAVTIRELPESNAAEAVGRLPGVSLLRQGGEGAKVVIRGLAPKYAKVQIEGVDITATGSADRSTDISMISP